MFYVLVFIRLFISFFLIILGKIFSIKKILDRELQSPFECGFSTFREHRLTFSLHFFIVALIFILFDVELIILFPLTMEVIFRHSLTVQIIFICFLLLLTIGLYREWDQGALEWE